MATTIKLKNGSGAPLAGDLVQGEPALDLTNKRLYTEDSGGTVIEVGTNPTSLTTGTFTSTGIDDNATSTAITIDSSENVGIGTTSPNALLHVSSSGNGEIEVERVSGALINLQAQSAVGVIGTDSNHDLRFKTNGAVRTSITASGNVGIGTASPAVEVEVASAAPQLRLTDTDGGYCEVTNVSGNLLLQADKGNSQSSSYMRFDVDNSERMRIDSSGNLLVGATATPTSSAGNIVLENGTAPTASATDGVILYAEDVSSSSELKVRDEAGNITTLSPHNFDLIPQGPSEDMAWSYYSERDGKQINVDMLKAIRVLEKLSGEQLVFEN